MQFVQPLKTEFTCKVCKEPWDPEAVSQCKDCQASFCKACYDESMMKEKECLSCHKQPATFGNVHMLVRSMASNLKVYCRYKAHGCDWTGVRTAYPGHMEACPKKPKEFTYVDESAIPVELMCPICNTAFTEPVELPCEHIFCQACIKEAVRRNPECPVDRSSVSLDDFKQPPSLITEILDEIPVFCAHKGATENPCAWTGRRRDYLGHRAMCKAGTSNTPATGTTATPDKKVTVVEPPKTAGGADAKPSTKSDKLTITPMTEFPFVKHDDTKKEIYALAHLQAPHLENIEQRKKPLSVSAVIDVSGSMAGGKLSRAQESLQFMIDELTDRDELGIIAFHTDMEETAPLLKMDAAGKRRARAAVEGLRAKACTNLSGGLFAGLNQLQRKKFDQLDCDKYTADGGVKRSNNAPGIHHFDPFSQSPAPAVDLLRGVKVGVTHYGYKMMRDSKPRYQYGCEITFNGATSRAISSIVMSGGTGVLGQKTLAITPQQPVHQPSPFDPFSGDDVFGFHPHHHHHHHHHTERARRPVHRPAPGPQPDVPHKFDWDVDRPEIYLSFKVHFHPTVGKPPMEHTIKLSDAGAFGNFDLPLPTTAAVIPTDAQNSTTLPPAQSADCCRAVLLFTDGAANKGITKEDALKRVLQKRMEPCPDVVVHTFGFGDDHNATLMQALAELASGSYYYINDVASMKESFADCLGGLMSTVAQNIQLTINPQPGFLIDRVMSSYAVKAIDGGASVVTMRDLYSSEQRDVLVRLKMKEAQPLDSVPSVVQFEVKFDSLISGATERVEADATVAMKATTCTDTPNTHVDEQRARIEVTEALKEARLEADAGDVAGAKLKMARTRQAMSSHHQATPYFNAMMVDMQQVEDQMASASTWASGGAKECAQVSNCHGAQRMNRAHCAPMAQQQAFAAYDNSFKAAARAKSHKH